MAVLPLRPELVDEVVLFGGQVYQCSAGEFFLNMDHFIIQPFGRSERWIGRVAAIAAVHEAITQEVFNPHEWMDGNDD